MRGLGCKIAMFGGGHNALVASAILAGHGAEVTIFEARSVGGAIEDISVEQTPGIPRAAATISLLHPKVLELLELDGEAFHQFFRTPAIQSCTIVGHDVAIFYSGETSRPHELGDIDPAWLRKWERDLENARSAVDDLWVDNRATAAKYRERLYEADPEFPQRFLDGSILAAIDHRMSTPLGRVALGYFSLLTPEEISAAGTAFALLYLSANGLPSRPDYVVPRAGMSSLARRFRLSAEKRGVGLRTGDRLASLVSKGHRIEAAILSDGSRIEADYFVMGFGPGGLGSLVSGGPPEAGQLSPQNRPATSGIKINTSGNKADLLRCFGRAGELPGLLRLCVSEAAAEAAVCSARFDEASEWPLVEIHFGETNANAVPVSIYGLFFPYTWCLQFDARERRRAIIARMSQTLSFFFPHLPFELERGEVLSGPELEQLYGMDRGDVDHGSLTMDNRIDTRAYGLLPHGRTPWDNLFICSSGIHPGGLVSGRPGLVCAQTMLEVLECE